MPFWKYLKLYWSMHILTNWTSIYTHKQVNRLRQVIASRFHLTGREYMAYRQQLRQSLAHYAKDLLKMMDGEHDYVVIVKVDDSRAWVYLHPVTKEQMATYPPQTGRSLRGSGNSFYFHYSDNRFRVLGYRTALYVHNKVPALPLVYRMPAP